MKKNILILLFALTTSLCFCQDFWTKLDMPEGLKISSVATDSMNRIYLGTNKGIYSSTDLGDSFSFIGPDNSFKKIYIDADDRLFATNSDEMYYSDNFGEDWSTVVEFPSIMVVSLYAKGSILIVGGGDGIHKSEDMGITWENVLDYGDICYIESIMQSSSGILFAGINSFMDYIIESGIICSKDNGNTWERTGLEGNRVSSIVENTQGVLFAGVGSHGKGEGNLYGNLFKSCDMGQTWTKATDDNFGISSLVIDSNNIIYRNRFMAVAMSGVFRSFDDGNTWEQLASGMSDSDVIDKLCMSKDGYLYACGKDNNYLYRSTKSVYDAIYSVSATISPVNSGEVTGVGAFSYGETVTLTATPNLGYEFENWTSETGEIISGNAIYTFDVTHDTSLIANFKTSTGINEFIVNRSSVTLYPNPVSDYLYIDVDKTSPFANIGNLNVILFDISGRLAYKCKTSEGKVNLSHIPVGFYNVCIECNGKFIYKKVLKM